MALVGAFSVIANTSVDLRLKVQPLLLRWSPVLTERWWRVRGYIEITDTLHPPPAAPASTLLAHYEQALKWRAKILLFTPNTFSNQLTAKVFSILVNFENSCADKQRYI